jgi:hypothetical protein
MINRLHSTLKALIQKYPDITGYTLRQGPGSDGPYVQPDWYIDLQKATGSFRIALYKETLITYSIYPNAGSPEIEELSAILRQN